MLILKAISENYDRFLLWYRDPRVEHYFLLGSPMQIFWIVLAYWIFIKKIGPKFMEKRQPYELRTAMLIYNAFQVLANCYVIYHASDIMFNHHLYADWSCMRYDRNSSDLRDINGGYMYVLLKVLDLMDTVFMVLRKRYNQISFLHVYHHILMAFSCTLFLTIYGCGHFLMLGYVNCFVHAIMYAYYFLSAFDSNLKKSLWWKKHLTQLQILQFLLLIVHFSRAIFHESCDQPRNMLIFSLAQAIVMIILFSNFYYKAYLSKPKSNKKVT